VTDAAAKACPDYPGRAFAILVPRIRAPTPGGPLNLPCACPWGRLATAVLPVVGPQLAVRAEAGEDVTAEVGELAAVLRGSGHG
jgi:hypothetical protein